MKRIVPVLLLCAGACLAADPVLIGLKEPDSAVLILDRESPNRQRPEAVIPASQGPGRVIVEHRLDPDTNDWTEVRWVFRFDLSRVPAAFRQAKLHLWCQGTAGSPRVSPKLEWIESSDPERIVSADRTSRPRSTNVIELLFPSNPQMIELDVTSMVKEAQKAKMSFAAFRISAVCDAPECKSDAPQNFYFGGYTNVWAWPKSEPPLLELTP